MPKLLKSTQATLDTAAAHARNDNHAGARRILASAFRATDRKADQQALADAHNALPH